MMNKISVGIKILGSSSILFSFILLLSFILGGSLKPLNMARLGYILTTAGWLIFGIGLLKRFNWARAGSQVWAAIFFIDTFRQPSYLILNFKNHPLFGLLFLVPSVFFFLSILIFFSIPSVKQEFIKITGET